jgi:hypothetical protein
MRYSRYHSMEDGSDDLTFWPDIYFKTKEELSTFQTTPLLSPVTQQVLNPVNRKAIYEIYTFNFIPLITSQK